MGQPERGTGLSGDMLRRPAYWISQGMRVSWYLLQYRVSSRLSRRAAARPARRRPTAGRPDLLLDLLELLQRDWSNIRAGVYRMPHDLVQDPRRLFARAVSYFRDLPEVDARRRLGIVDEVAARPDGRRGLPGYYLQNFHYQTDGYLSEHSARLYDHQVEVLFFGSADAMRRQALVPIAGFLRGRDIARTRLLDVGCGTGRFLTFVKDNYPCLPVVALDLSRYYLAEARRQLRRWRGIRYVEGLAESLPAASASVDIVTCLFVLHEIPPERHGRIAAEFARVLRPGGRLVLVDSLQLGDSPPKDGLIETFPQAFHEPYYAHYARSDLAALFAGAGLRHVGSDIAFLSKVMVFAKPA